jgi:hypothetical protein
VAEVLERRLAVAEDRLSHPEIADEVIRRPLFVVGFPRTGTTLLHALLAQDPECRVPQLWEVRNPSPPPGTTGPDLVRQRLGDEDADDWCRCIPGILAAHPYFDLGWQVPVEDEEIMALDFHSTYPTWYRRVPIMVSVPYDPVEAFMFHRAFLQHLQWRRPVGHWALKGTSHQFWLDALLQVYPDAVCVWPHREPAETFGSLLQLLSLVHSGLVGDVDRRALAEETLGGLQAGLFHALTLPVIDDKRIVHVRYRALVGAPAETIRAVYARADLPMTGAFERRIAEWLADPGHRSDRHGAFTYTLYDFGLTEDDVNRRFREYIDRFLV